MKIVQQEVHIIPQNNLLEHIERCGRVCYKSEDKIGPGTAEKFVERLTKSGHTSVLEHGTVYLLITGHEQNSKDILQFYQQNKYSVVEVCDTAFFGPRVWIITTNYRVLVENNRLGDLELFGVSGKTKGWYQPPGYTDDKHLRWSERVTIEFITNRAIANELVRHRVMSPSQESTRWIAYTKGRFDGDICFVDNGRLENQKYIQAWEEDEKLYRELLADGEKPEDARDVLGLGLKTDLILTGSVEHWLSLADLRCPKNAHHLVRYLAFEAIAQLNQQGYITNDEYFEVCEKMRDKWGG